MSTQTQNGTATAQAQTSKLAPVATIAALWAQVEAGDLDLENFFSTACQSLHLARVIVTSVVESLIARERPDAPVIGAGADDYTERDRASLETVTSEPEQADMRLRRFVASTISQYAADELISIGAEYGSTAWRWVTVGDNCEFCDSRDGLEFELSEERRTHMTCDCEVELIFDQSEESHA